MTDNDGCGETSSEKKEKEVILEEPERARVSDQEENNKEENVETHRSTDDLVFHSISKEDKNYEYENEHPMFKLYEGKYVEEYVSDEISRDETIKQGRYAAERCYRTKQLDDDDHENLDGARKLPEEIRDTCDQNNEGAEIINKEFIVACQPKDYHVLDTDCISDVGSIPSSLPSLESEPEETCLPLKILNVSFIIYPLLLQLIFCTTVQKLYRGKAGVFETSLSLELGVWSFCVFNFDLEMSAMFPLSC